MIEIILSMDSLVNMSVGTTKERDLVLKNHIFSIKHRITIVLSVIKLKKKSSESSPF